MLSKNLTTQFGKFFASTLRELKRFEGFISRDANFLKAGYMKCYANENVQNQTFNNNFKSYNNKNVTATTASCVNRKNNVQSMSEKQEIGKNLDCPNSSKLKTTPPSSSFKLAKVWTPAELQIFEPKHILNVEMKAQKRFLNATTKKASTSTTTTTTTPPLITTTRASSLLQAMSMIRNRSVFATLRSSLGATTQHNIAKRWYGQKVNYRDKCAEWCGEDPCKLNRKITHLKKSMWLAPNCYPKCQKPYRYDIVHMPGSNKETREYQQTWIECPPIRIVKKPVCCFEPKCLPPICRRPRKVPKPAPSSHGTCGVNICRGSVHHPDCEKVREPCCKVKARDVPCCKIYPTRSCCQKRCTPYPSFSECCRPESNRKRPVECFCLIKPTMCEVWADWRRKHLPGQYEDL